MRRDMRDVKCRAAHGVIRALRGVDVLYVESFVLDQWRAQWRPWGTRFFDDLQVLVRDEQIDDLMAAMEAGGYVPYDRHAGRYRPLDPERAKRAVLKIPVSPEPFYVHPGWVSETGEPDLLVRFHTTRRHGRLMLADLKEWFDQRGQCPVMGGTDYETEVGRPPLWAMMLWQAGEIMNHASDCAVTKEEVDKLHVVAAQQTGHDWQQVLAKARQYGGEYDRRVNCPDASQLLGEYRQGLGISNAKLQKAEREYGALYELSHALKALMDYGAPYRDAVPGDVWGELAPFTAQRPRKLWGYPGGQEDVPLSRARGRLGIADAGFGIHTQVEEHHGADFDHLVRHGLATVLLRGCPPHGPWAHCTARRLRNILR